MRPFVVLLSWGDAPMLALGVTDGLGGALGLEGVSLTGVVSLGGGGLGAGTGISGVSWGFGVTGGFPEVLQIWGSETGDDRSGEVSGFRCNPVEEGSVGSAGLPVATPSSQNPLLDGFGPDERVLGFGATTGGTDFDGCPWRRGRGRGSGLVAGFGGLCATPQLPSAPCCSKA